MDAKEYIESIVTGKSVYCYGAGYYGKTVAYALFLCNCDFKGFIVSDASGIEDEILHKKVNEIKGISLTNQDVILVCAGMPARKSIEYNLLAKGFQNYYVVSDEVVSELDRRVPFDTEIDCNGKVNFLLYHRVCDLENDVWNLAVSKKDFELQMRYLVENYKISRFDEDFSKVVEKTFVITFDDGYYDNYLNAIPILVKYNIPATIFISTDNIDKRDEFWWDKLEKAIYCNDLLVDKEQTIREMRNEIMQLNKQGRDKFFEKMNISSTVNNVMNRSLNSEEIRNLAKHPLITLGAHTKSHCRLSQLSYEEQKKEILDSKKILEDITKTQISVFSYPFGNSGDYNKYTVEIVKECGFTRAAAVKGGLYSVGCNEYEIPRNNIPGGTDLEQFKKLIRKQWFEY